MCYRKKFFFNCLTRIETTYRNWLVNQKMKLYFPDKPPQQQLNMFSIQTKYIVSRDTKRRRFVTTTSFIHKFAYSVARFFFAIIGQQSQYRPTALRKQKIRIGDEKAASQVTLNKTHIQCDLNMYFYVKRFFIWLRNSYPIFLTLNIHTLIIILFI